MYIQIKLRKSVTCKIISENKTKSYKLVTLTNKPLTFMGNSFISVMGESYKGCRRCYMNQPDCDINTLFEINRNNRYSLTVAYLLLDFVIQETPITKLDLL